MNTRRDVPGLRAQLSSAPRPVGLVPTMGALHDGHLSLVRRAREECATVVVSLFVNPAQFAAGEDLAAYPRDEHGDASVLAAAGADVLFAPPGSAVYPRCFATAVEVSGVTETLEGDRTGRGPAHFRGVATVVAKLLNMVGPDVAYLGQKDAQQALVIRRLVRDLDFPLRVEVCPTVREPDGLAMSSRNAYLGPDDRRRAAALSRALRAAEAEVASGERDGDAVLAAARAELARDGVEPEYLELRRPRDLSPVPHVGGPTLLLLAARVGPARLIDNLLLDAAPDTGPAENRRPPELALASSSATRGDTP